MKHNSQLYRLPTVGEATEEDSQNLGKDSRMFHSFRLTRIIYVTPVGGDNF